MSRFNGPQSGVKGSDHTKGVMRLIRAAKRAEAVERDELHRQGKRCSAPTCPYPKGGKHGSEARERERIARKRSANNTNASSPDNGAASGGPDSQKRPGRSERRGKTVAGQPTKTNSGKSSKRKKDKKAK